VELCGGEVAEDGLDDCVGFVDRGACGGGLMEV